MLIVGRVTDTVNVFLNGYLAMTSRLPAFLYSVS